MEYKYLFGPVPSRRLGVSAGIDLVPYKTCSLNCLYCECGTTTKLTLKRKEYIPTEKVIKELNHFLQSAPEIDYLTFSGSGEPTLHNHLGKIVNYLKENYSHYNIALLTNGTLFYKYDSLYNEVKNIDLIIPSLDAVSENIFKKINRGINNLKSEEIISGLIKLRKEYHGEIWLEIFVIPGINDTKKEINNFNTIIKKIKPEKVQLNSLDRPGTEKNIKKPDFSNMKVFADSLDTKTEIITEFKNNNNIKEFKSQLKNNIIETLKRRPCTKNDLAKILGKNNKKINKIIKKLMKKNLITKQKSTRGEFFFIKKKQ